ncbi:MAG: hypothetical protein ACK5HR_05255, partial [Mycoplasmatales bacterium]
NYIYIVLLYICRNTNKGNKKIMENYLIKNKETNFEFKVNGYRDDIIKTFYMDDLGSPFEIYEMGEKWIKNHYFTYRGSIEIDDDYEREILDIKGIDIDDFRDDAVRYNFIGSINFNYEITLEIAECDIESKETIENIRNLDSDDIVEYDDEINLIDSIIENPNNHSDAILNLLNDGYDDGEFKYVDSAETTINEWVLIERD